MADTTARALRLLDLLQSRTVWPGAELAAELGVTDRSLRRDVARLRELGYPVESSHGAGGGYQLGRGRALPPLLLSDDEAVAVAVCLRLAANGTVEGLADAAVRTLAKLDQVLPSRLRAGVETLSQATATLEFAADPVDGEALLTLARGCRETERVRFSYVARDGASTQRWVEPYRLVATGRRWYLMARDVDRDDWRSFRVDRMSEVAASGWRFTPAADAPDPIAFVQRSISASPYEHVVRVRIDAAADDVRRWIPPTAGTVTELGTEACELSTGGIAPEFIAVHLVRMPWSFEVLDPPELRTVMRDLADRLLATAGPA